MFGVGLCHIFAFGFILLHCTRYKLLFPKVLCATLSGGQKYSTEIVTKGCFGSFFDQVLFFFISLTPFMPLTINKTILQKLSFS